MHWWQEKAALVFVHIRISSVRADPSSFIVMPANFMLRLMMCLCEDLIVGGFQIEIMNHIHANSIVSFYKYFSSPVDLSQH